MSKEAVISTGRLNHYGTRVITSGIDLKQYERNPIVLWTHNRYSPWQDQVVLPIGTMTNLRIDGDALIGTPVFDESDEFARSIKNKWESGFLRMVSAGLEIVETSDDPELLVLGQTRATITKSRLYEVSIVDIGANDDAIQLNLYRGGKMLDLADGLEQDALPPLLALSNQNQPNTDVMNRKILELLGLASTATEDEAIHAIELMRKELDETKTAQLSMINALVADAKADGRLSDEQVDHFTHLGKKLGVESLRLTLAAIPKPSAAPTAPPRPTIALNSKGASDVPKSWEAMTDAERLELKQADSDTYQALVSAYYGIK